MSTMTVAAAPLPLREWLEHAYQEALDLPIYLKRAIEEIDRENAELWHRRTPAHKSMKQKTDPAAAETARTTDSPAVVHERLVRLLGFFGIRKTSGMVKPSAPTPAPPPRKDPELPKWAEEWNALVAKMPVGTVIEYLGLKLMVVGIGEAYLMRMYWGESCGFWTAEKLRCEYVDARGIIRTKEFTVNEALHCLPNADVEPPRERKANG